MALGHSDQMLVLVPGAKLKLEADHTFAAAAPKLKGSSLALN